jgi:hypothetical protein
MKKKTTNYALELALAAGATTNKDQNRPKAKGICVGIDTALKTYQAARKVDNGAIGPVANLYSEQGLQDRLPASGGALLAAPGSLDNFIVRVISPEGRTENSPGLQAWAILFSPFGRRRKVQISQALQATPSNVFPTSPGPSSTAASCSGRLPA